MIITCACLAAPPDTSRDEAETRQAAYEAAAAQATIAKLDWLAARFTDATTNGNSVAARQTARDIRSVVRRGVDPVMGLPPQVGMVGVLPDAPNKLSEYKTQTYTYRVEKQNAILAPNGPTEQVDSLRVNICIEDRGPHPKPTGSYHVQLRFAEKRLVRYTEGRNCSPPSGLFYAEHDAENGGIMLVEFRPKPRYRPSDELANKYLTLVGATIIPNTATFPDE